MILALALIALVGLQRLAELLVARRNYHWAMAQGGKEYGAAHYPLLVFLHLAWMAAILGECYVRRPEIPGLWPLFLGLILLAQFLRYWAISSLGRQWNTRIIVVAGMAKITTGVYRYCRHPNYWAVAIELAMIPALLGAWYSSLIFTLANALLLLFIRIPAEERALEGLDPPAEP